MIFTVYCVKFEPLFKWNAAKNGAKHQAINQCKVKKKSYNIADLEYVHYQITQKSIIIMPTC